MGRRLSDDEKRVFSDQITLLKNENERLSDALAAAQVFAIELKKELETLKKATEVLSAEDARKGAACAYLIHASRLDSSGEIAKAEKALRAYAEILSGYANDRD